MRSVVSVRRPPRDAYSLLELVAAVALIAGTLVPAMELMRAALRQSIETDRRTLMASYGVSEMEQLLAVTASTWSEGSRAGDYTADGNSDIRFETNSSDDLIDGGVDGLLMDLRVTTYYDKNGDDALSAGEPSCAYRTKIGRFSTYEAMSP